MSNMVDFDNADKQYFESIVKDPGVIPTGLISVVTWIDPLTGARKWRLVNDVDMPLTECVGLLELAKIELIRRTAPYLYKQDDLEE